MQRVTLKDLQNVVSLLHDDDIFCSQGDVIISSTLWERIIETIRYNDNMAGEKFKAPTLSQATPGFLVDELGTIKSEIKPRATYEKMLSTILKDVHRPANNFLEGEFYTCTFNWVSKLIFDSEKFKGWLANPASIPNATFEDFQKPSEYWECRTSLKVPVTK